MTDKPSLMVREFLVDDSKNTTKRYQTSFERSVEESWPEEAFQRHYCFFYGTLMDPDILSRVLKSSKKPPIMHRARVMGYQVKLWGLYPALLDGESLNPVDGMAYELRSQTQLDRLATYETEQYRLQACLIDLLSDDGVGKTIEGVTFVWNGEQDELKEGTFNLKQWKKEEQLRALD
ncbi:hypothetical protein N7532_000293 [Penicillium argentinense]|uniref:Putative gamma-glutamylcyclotransferase n=1 Tax=Penicillium argentinense TaxID=1131581 RepID=A0A9W9G5D6_9EURO|nr:uncharacterized protein N7532_000293 [Penicillium argentinense]KAJ5112248.1 hypothetical protein N7532_000293 [Penicillium argentinense]